MKSFSLFLLVILLSLTLGGCQSASSLAQKAAEFEQLGITEAEITGKFSHTEYKVERSEDGTRTATLDHSNAWLPKVRIVRQTKE
jgi:outer membrane lipoprotein-sorting protein